MEFFYNLATAKFGNTFFVDFIFYTDAIISLAESIKRFNHLKEVIPLSILTLQKLISPPNTIFDFHYCYFGQNF